jgi:hypothetical protein
MLLDEESWPIRYLIVNTSNWWLGHPVLVAPEWSIDASWMDRRVTIDLTRQPIRDCPAYESALLPDRSQEAIARAIGSTRRCRPLQPTGGLRRRRRRVESRRSDRELRAAAWRTMRGQSRPIQHFKESATDTLHSMMSSATP